MILSILKRLQFIPRRYCVTARTKIYVKHDQRSEKFVKSHSRYVNVHASKTKDRIYFYHFIKYRKKNRFWYPQLEDRTDRSFRSFFPSHMLCSAYQKRVLWKKLPCLRICKGTGIYDTNFNRTWDESRDKSVDHFRKISN